MQHKSTVSDLADKNIIDITPPEDKDPKDLTFYQHTHTLLFKTGMTIKKTKPVANDYWTTLKTIWNTPVQW